jgi:hypothetical protein
MQGKDGETEEMLLKNKKEFTAHKPIFECYNERLLRQ